MVGIVLDRLVFRPGGRAVLDGLCARIPPLGVTALVGPNGAGKSVTLRMIDGLLAPDSGRVHFDGRPAERVRRAFVFQRPALIRASVAANVALALTPYRQPADVTAERVARALGRVGLGGRAGDAARRLSGGEQQRLALARALAIDPELLLLDEPTANLDPGTSEAIEAIIADVAAAGTKVVMVSHNLGQLARLARDVLVLARGRAVEHGAVYAVLNAPAAPETRAFIRGELPWTGFAAAS